MKLSGIIAGISLLSVAQPVLARPGNPYADLMKELQRRADVGGVDPPGAVEAPDTADENNDGDTAPVMIGDLRQGATTDVGRSIYNILMRTEDAVSDVSGYSPPGLLGSRSCKADTCCVWWYVSKVLTLAFTGVTGRCNDAARAAIRLGFHDAGAWSLPNANAGKDFGGADGSIALDGGNEIARPENNGLQDILKQVKIWQKMFGVGMADLIQFAAIHATVTCPLGPRVRFFAGRVDSTRPAPDGLLPDVHASADNLIQLFENKTISAHDLVALVGAHSTSKQFGVDKKKAGQPQDTTPGVWDVSFYNQTVSTAPMTKVFKFESDVKLAADSRTIVEWQHFMEPLTGQDHWNKDYARAYTRLSLLGVNVINQMTECTKVLPKSKKTFLFPKVNYLDQ